MCLMHAESHLSRLSLTPFAVLSQAAKGKDIPTVLHVTGYVLEKLPYVFGGSEPMLLQLLLRLILFVAEKHRWDMATFALRFSNASPARFSFSCQTYSVNLASPPTSSNSSPPCARHLMEQVIGLAMLVTSLVEPCARRTLLEDMLLGATDLLLGEDRVTISCDWAVLCPSSEADGVLSPTPAAK